MTRTAFASKKTSLRLVAMALAVSVVAGCGLGGEAVYRDDTAEKLEETRGSILGNDQVGINNDSDRPDASGGDSGIGVNSYLWRASLDTVSFMPLASADPFGGVIITDWYSPPESAAERFKINVYILGRDLRADGVRAAVFRQLQDPRNGAWVDAVVEGQTPVDIENAILTRARQLRIASLQ
ncbi:DUF3576 domain-containing protein [Pelagibius litoralis]|uniref:DUF3576 domain-containing protein n=1 Tax=Pelagibius litoralis TaxID=374515 RepID=A0A967F2A3_9PROT|nr:DUF3576 domain-containing protein [Pelagibius litoralis]NIA71687.1 DUF3576 domain-containing protein [Pelagibius litoralis]